MRSVVAGHIRLLPTLLVLLWTLAGAQAWAADVRELQVQQSGDATQLVLDLSEAVEYSVFVLENPHRVVIDLKHSRLRADTRRLSLRDLPVRAIRSAVRNTTDTRIVLDMDRPMNPSSSLQTFAGGAGHRLIVDLYDLDREVPARGVRQHTGTTAIASDSSSRRNIVVAIDAGHGGTDPGAIAYDGKIFEKEVAFSIARALYERIKSLPGFEPVMIRQGDYFVRLQQRPQLARQNRADIFLSIHADSHSGSRAEGVTVYALSQTTAEDENIRRVTEKENSADLLGGVSGDTSLRNFEDDLALTLLDISMAWSIEQSMSAGSHILESIGRVTRLRRDVPQQGNFWVLRSPDIPSLLIETGYLSNPNEARKLNSPDYQRRLADSIAQGVVNYFYDRPPDGTLLAWQKANNQGPDREYVVVRGDSLSMIAQRHNVELARLRAANNLRGDTIHVGQKLIVPGGGPIAIALTAAPVISEHTISRGETLSGIAQRYRVSLASLRDANNLRNDTIRIGQVLIIPSS
ncbi:N-acetylmuramoyl-L-alanine amidase [Pseudohongiella spirulinae]|uniref:N-acetylmuramoyl-L-alanine amidase n=1 Tax=Pseudohongiella spirulinae TaxID=1249552 RepID=A0A0S2KGS9_9GAMM|nr:N-acetylmuramoyl-L-alanine amidase [Pseudohongiella spirulinae]ALO47236.1 N-acetylmuramoyl-L-alanine amidase [Pseudohongiella spirulinae]